jgi:HEPN domain-containing protein
LPTPEELEVAELFLRKAASDLAAARTLAAAPDQQDDVVGFHAQQAVEKSLKAVVTIRSLEIPLTHDIDLLLRLLEAGVEKPPDEFQEAKSLSPWAVEMRYGEMDAVLDRAAAIRIAGAVLSWSQGQVDATREPQSSDVDSTPPAS